MSGVRPVFTVRAVRAIRAVHAVRAVRTICAIRAVHAVRAIRGAQAARLSSDIEALNRSGLHKRFKTRRIRHERRITLILCETSRTIVGYANGCSTANRKNFPLDIATALALCAIIRVAT